MAAAEIDFTFDFVIYLCGQKYNRKKLNIAKNLAKCFLLMVTFYILGSKFMLFSCRKYWTQIIIGLDNQIIIIFLLVVSSTSKITDLLVSQKAHQPHPMLQCEQNSLHQWFTCAAKSTIEKIERSKKSCKMFFADGNFLYSRFKIYVVFILQISIGFILLLDSVIKLLLFSC